MTSYSLLIMAGLLGSTQAEPSAVGPLITALHDSDVEVRVFAGMALGQLGTAAIEPLQVALIDPDKHMRAGAAYALGQCGIAAKPAKAALLKALNDEQKDVRRQAAYALSRLLTAEREQAAPPARIPDPVFP